MSMRALGLWLCLLGGCCLPGRAAMPPALSIDGVTLCPLRYIAEWFGARVDYHKPTRHITIRAGECTIGLTIDSAVAAVDGRPVPLAQPALLKDGLTYVPVRFVAEALGARVDDLASLDREASGLISVRNSATGDLLVLRLVGGDIQPLSAPGLREAMVLAAAANGPAMELGKLLVETPALRNARDQQGETALYKASAAGRLDCVSQLLMHRADATLATIDRRTPLHAAVEGGWEKIAALLIAHGARFNAKDLLSVTPLHLAARRGRADLVKMLLDYGVYPDAKDLYGQTSLFDAAGAGDVPTATLLLDAGAKVDAYDVDRYTPLHRAAAAGKAEIVTLLLARGAAPAPIAKGGKTPRRLAEEKRFTTLAALLKAAGG